MDTRDRHYLKRIVEADDGTIVDGDDVALNRDVRDPRLDGVGEHLANLDDKLRELSRELLQFRRLSQVLTIVPEADPRRLNGLTTEISIDLEVIAQAIERLQPRLKTAMDLVGSDSSKDVGWI